MDPTRFDMLSRTISAAVTRRTLFGALAGLVASVGGAGLPGAAAERRRRLGAQGPCGNGGPKANRCQRDRDCCTGVCQPVRKARYGRCRCRQRGELCSEDRNCCRGRGQRLTCQQRRCRPAAPPVLTCGTGGPCRVFITSALYQGDLRESGQGSGIAGADAKCQALAEASPRTRGGAYKAWLSDSTPASGPAARFANTANTGPYVLVDDAGTEIARDWADLTDGSLRAPILVTELGQAPELPWNTWTYTLPDGTPGGAGLLHCQDWTLAAFGPPGDDGAPGDAISTDSQWTRWGNRRFCDFFLHLYCFEQG